MHRYSQDELIMPVRYPLAIIPHPDLLTGEVSISALRFRQWGERARLAGGRSGETRGIGRWSGGVLGRVAAVP